MEVIVPIRCISTAIPPLGDSLTSIEIIAHRGASREQPENTIAAFARALELRADGVELDVHLRSDGVLVVHHDAIPQTPRDSIPTLQQVIDAVRASLTIYCELKGPGTAAAACALLGASSGRSAVHSFDHRQIAAARAISSAIPRGVLETSYHIDPLASLRSVDARDLWQEKELIDGALIDAVHSVGGRVIAWTVDAPNDIERLAALGIDGICTNDVATARRVLGR
jgi:glycerophosphoryl diester phosphodiesterase